MKVESLSWLHRGNLKEETDSLNCDPKQYHKYVKTKIDKTQERSNSDCAEIKLIQSST